MMCIICNCTVGDNYHKNILAAEKFLKDYEKSQKSMSFAAKTLLSVSSIPELDPQTKRQYDSIHKRMRRLIREWNKLEHEREKAFRQEKQP